MARTGQSGQLTGHPTFVMEPPAHISLHARTWTQGQIKMHTASDLNLLMRNFQDRDIKTNCLTNWTNDTGKGNN